MGVLFGLLAIMAIGGAIAATANEPVQYGPGYGKGYGLKDGSNEGFAPRDGTGYGRGRGMMGAGFANGGDIENCPMHEALEAQGITADEFAQWHKEMYESGKRGPLAMRELLESKGVDTSLFPAPGWRRQ